MAQRQLDRNIGAVAEADDRHSGQAQLPQRRGDVVGHRSDREPVRASWGKSVRPRIDSDQRERSAQVRNE